ncbi:SIR2-like domain-containing protein [Actinopolymorpha cephalotaxi]|uniref:SIR2-like domain-containing protein n=1 Tax=Actinopolymorpha cephalotaxi TaxID=504797 RepID=A0A1I3C6N4_9ACTN|nr:SIR2-like domain-containing protein [Actinopolymorpha cephalotaxi]
MRLRAARKLGSQGDLPGAFQLIQESLAESSLPLYESVHYEGYLSDVFRSPALASSDLLESLRNLNPRLIITTNYDLLLEEYVTQSGAPAPSVTWLNPSQIKSMIRIGRGVVHLHGRYDVPRSVVLSTSDYQRVVSEHDATEIATAIFHSGVLLFVGASLEGMGDPHLSKLLDSFARIKSDSDLEESPHMALLAGRPEGSVVARLRRLGVDACTYGTAYEELPTFIRSISGPDEITIRARPVRNTIETVSRAGSLGEAVGSVGEFIKSSIFRGRDVRVTYTELTENSEGDRQLESRYVFPANPTRNVFNYPLSIAAWALLEGRIIEWPRDAESLCNLGLVDHLGRLRRARELLDRDYTQASPEIQRYVDLVRVRKAMDSRTLTLKDFFQDWDSAQPRSRYAQFLSVPVPIVDSFGNREKISEYGVFNIDSNEELPLLDVRSEESLKLASAIVATCYSVGAKW